MSKEEAMKILLVDVCCSNGGEFCKVCPLKDTEDCKSFHYDESQLLRAIKVLNE